MSSAVAVAFAETSRPSGSPPTEAMRSGRGVSQSGEQDTLAVTSCSLTDDCRWAKELPVQIWWVYRLDSLLPNSTDASAPAMAG